MNQILKASQLGSRLQAQRYTVKFAAHVIWNPIDLTIASTKTSSFHFDTETIIRAMSSDSESENQLRRDRDLAELNEWFHSNENLPREIGKQTSFSVFSDVICIYVGQYLVLANDTARRAKGSVFAELLPNNVNTNTRLECWPIRMHTSIILNEVVNSQPSISAIWIADMLCARCVICQLIYIFICIYLFCRAFAAAPVLSVHVLPCGGHQEAYRGELCAAEQASAFVY